MHTVFGRYLEAVASCRDRMKEARVLWIFLERQANFADCSVDAVVDVDEDVFAPNVFENLLAGDEMTLPLGQKEKDVQGDALEVHYLTAAPELAGRAVQLEVGKTEPVKGHAGTPGRRRSAVLSFAAII